MSDRVTIQGDRPRLTGLHGIWLPSTVASMEDAGYIGPFTRRQFTELCYRVKAIRIQASVSWDDGIGGSGTDTMDVTLVRRDDSNTAVTNERRITPDIIGPEFPFVFTDGFSGFGAFLTGAGPAYKDENGSYWIEGTSGPALAVNQNAIILSADGSTPGSPPDNQRVFPANVLTFSDATTAPLVLVVASGNGDITSASASTTITEWFPYKTTAGLAAWNTATGAIANGGPGA